MLIDDRDGNGFWENFTISSIYGKFVCAEENCTRDWKSKQIQVDMKVSYIHCIKGISMKHKWANLQVFTIKQ